MIGWLWLLVIAVMVLGIADAVCHYLESRPRRNRRLPRPNWRSARSGREPW